MSARVVLLTVVCLALGACTPEYVKQGSQDLMTQFRLTDSIDVERSNSQLLSRHGQVCLASELAGTDAGGAMLRSMQAAFSGYFVAVGIEHEPMDYMRTLAGNSCPGAAYLFYVQPYGDPICADPAGPQPAAVDGGEAPPCARRTYSQLVITIITGRDRMLLDRIKFSLRKGYLPFGDKDDAQQLSQAFERLAAALTGVSR